MVNDRNDPKDSKETEDDLMYYRDGVLVVKDIPNKDNSQIKRTEHGSQNERTS